MISRLTIGSGLSRNILCVVRRVTSYVEPGIICLGALMFFTSNISYRFGGESVSGKINLGEGFALLV